MKTKFKNSKNIEKWDQLIDTWVLFNFALRYELFIIVNINRLLNLKNDIWLHKSHWEKVSRANTFHKVKNSQTHWPVSTEAQMTKT